MDFRIADTFTASLGRLTANEQKAVKTTAFDLQIDASAPGLSFHRIDRAKDPNFWSVRVNADIRIIVHKTPGSLLLCYVDHHDDAYAWAERRKIERHPTTGAAQLVEVRERVLEYASTREKESIWGTEPEPAARFLPPLFLDLNHDDLMGVGVPAEWVEAVQNATEISIFDLADHLPSEAVEALLDYVSTGVLRPAITGDLDGDAFSHPDALRRFRVVENVDELQRALDYPWEKWTVFLHPAQRQLVEKDYGGPVRVSGSAGTGKTVVALHRAVFLAQRHPGSRVLLTTFSKSLANALRVKLTRLADDLVAERIEVRAVTGVGYDLHTQWFGQPNIASAATVHSLLMQAAKSIADGQFPARFLLGEWSEVVDAWQIRTWEEYRDVARLGRKTRIGGKQREILWAVFSQVRADLAQRKLVTWADVFGRVTEKLSSAPKPFDFAVVDEAQDVSVSEMRFLAALAGGRPDGLFFAGDLGQRIFQQPFSWKSLGVDVRGRSHTLRICYRTSHQIRSQADRLLPDSVTDVDGNAESRKGTVSVFDGPVPKVVVCDDEDAETNEVASWLIDLIEDGIQTDEIGVFVRSERELRRARAALKAAGIPATELDETADMPPGHVAITTMHLAKGLEFRAVVVMACDDDVLPQQSRIESITDEADLEEVYNTERHLLYVACTRAREFLRVTGVDPASEFLADFEG